VGKDRKDQKKIKKQESIVNKGLHVVTRSCKHNENSCLSDSHGRSHWFNPSIAHHI